MFRTSWATAAPLMLALIAGGVGAAHAQSFDCHKASTVVEHGICADRALGELGAPPRAGAPVCRIVADRYRPLAASHPGETPLSVLAATAGTGIVVEPGNHGRVPGIGYLATWGARQSPPVNMDDVIAAAKDFFYGSEPLIDHIAGTPLYSLVVVQGTANCLSAVFFTVANGRAQVVDGPPGLSGDDGRSCMVSLEFGSVGGSPAYFQEEYLYSPRMDSSLSVGLIHGAKFADSCVLNFRFLPVFAAKPLNHWEETCDVADCDGLRRQALTLAGSVQADAAKTLHDALLRLNPRQQAEYADALKLASPAGPAGTDPAAFTDTAPLQLPWVYQGRLYLVSLGHFTIGWRQYGDWSVIFSQAESGRLVGRASFAVGMQKGPLESVLINGVATTEPAQ